MSGTKEEYLKYRTSKSQEIFEDAKILANNGRWNSCVNRLYYSSFHLASALIFKNGIKSDSHKSVKIHLYLHFVKTGILSKEDGKLYSHLFDWRQESDYADFIDFVQSDVEPLVKQVENLNLRLKVLIEE